ncbi:hypothetical protein C0J52_26842 [Blattella germanica]|nr:hypothetical protein C0J52_26842 [Blattella germanica]
MAESENQCVENAFNILIGITEKSGNLRKDYKKDIRKSVSTLRKAFNELKSSLESKADENKKLKDEVKNAREELHRQNHSRPARQVAASTGHTQEIPGCGARVLPPPDGSRPKLYSDAVKGNIEKRYKITVKAKDNSQSSEQVKTLLKKNINPTGIKVGIKAFRSLHDGRIILETGSEDEINALCSNITDKCGQQLEVTKHTLRKPKIIIYNVSEDLELENASAMCRRELPAKRD